MSRGPIKISTDKSVKCQNCKSAKANDGLSFLRCSVHKCSVHGGETCDKFEVVVK